MDQAFALHILYTRALFLALIDEKCRDLRKYTLNAMHQLITDIRKYERKGDRCNNYEHML